MDGFREHAGVFLRPCAHGTIQAKVYGARDILGVQKHIQRLLCEGLIGAAFSGAAFHCSSYEAAAWTVLAENGGPIKAQVLRDRLALELGETFELGGERRSAFPIPSRLLKVSARRGLGRAQVPNLHAVATAALQGKFDPRTRSAPALFEPVGQARVY
ncbi:MAG: hypothetical protein M3126_02780 [Candidatus Eremiobacteraeota bacterium]|nr:hypothetical protein [Candidatus Eremiobacteraeota bacterium]